MNLRLDLLRDLWGPGLVFLLLIFWLVRKAWKAARTEGELEHEREYYAAQAVRDREREAAATAAGQAMTTAGQGAGTRPHAVPDEASDPLAGADLSHARADHVAAVTALLLGESPRRPVEIAWVRSLGHNVAWLERGLAGAQSLRVARIESGAAVERWTFE